MADLVMLDDSNEKEIVGEIAIVIREPFVLCNNVLTIPQKDAIKLVVNILAQLDLYR